MSSHLITVTSQHDFETTRTALRDGIAKRPLTLFAEIDHAAGAASADLSLAPSTLFIFGNPKGGTPLMNLNPQMGIALPLKMHIYQDGNVVMISYADINAVLAAYGVKPENTPAPKIAAMLHGLAEEAAQ